MEIKQKYRANIDFQCFKTEIHCNMNFPMYCEIEIKVFNVQVAEFMILNVLLAMFCNVFQINPLFSMFYLKLFNVLRIIISFFNVSLVYSLFCNILQIIKFISINLKSIQLTLQATNFYHFTNDMMQKNETFITNL